MEIALKETVGKETVSFNVSNPLLFATNDAGDHLRSNRVLSINIGRRFVQTSKLATICMSIHHKENKDQESVHFSSCFFALGVSCYQLGLCEHCVVVTFCKTAHLEFESQEYFSIPA